MVELEWLRALQESFVDDLGWLGLAGAGWSWLAGMAQGFRNIFFERLCFSLHFLNKT